MNILKEVFKIDGGQYARKNRFWECKHILSMLEEEANNDINSLNLQVGRIKKRYAQLSTTYQNQKENSVIPLN